MCKFVMGPLILKCNRNGHGAVRHGSENENIIFPQTMENRPYPTWNQRGENEIVFGPGGVQGEFAKTLLKQKCCVAINPWWLTPYFHQKMNDDAYIDDDEA